MTDTLINGVATEFISVMDRGLQYGDGVFETVLYKDGKLQFWEQHISRMRHGAENLRINMPEEQDFFKDASILIKQNQHKSAVIKLILTRGSGERGYATIGKQHPMRIALISPHRQAETPEAFKATICQQTVSSNKGLAGIKHLCRLENVIARNEWKDDYQEGIMLDIDKHVIEGTMSNIFLVKNKEVFTPDLSSCGIKGIIRQNIFNIANDESISLVEKKITIDELINSEEIFITNSVLGIRTIGKINDTEFHLSETARYFKNQLDQLIPSHAKAIH